MYKREYVSGVLWFLESAEWAAMSSESSSLSTPASLLIIDDAFTVSCKHGFRTTKRLHDPITPESDEWMVRYALQRHVDRCELGCTIHLWNDWFEQRRQRFLAEGNTKAHG